MIFPRPLSPQIAVVGAGAAGLVASRHLLRCGFRPTIFEASSTVGGLWNTDSGRTWESMTPNLSRFTTCFSDFAWSSDSELFPSRQAMQTYLNNYCAEYLELDLFRMNCEVTNIEQAEGEKSKYKVEWIDSSGAVNNHQFDGVVIASGFFSVPIIPEALHSFPCIHSKDYKSPDSFENKTVVVCGSSFSALEIASDLSKKTTRVITIMPRTPWLIPRFVPLDVSMNCTPFVPVDIAFYRRAQSAPQKETVFASAEGNRVSHCYLRRILGRKQESVIGLPDDDTSPIFRSVTDSFASLVAAGKIQLVKGRLQSSIADPKKLVLDTGEVIQDFDALISCTGFRPKLDFLSDKILKTLKFQDDSFAPLVLCYDTLHPDLDRLGFVGMYRGTYFGVMELQARLLSESWSRQIVLTRSHLDDALRESELIRQQIPRPQFPHNDYVGFMDRLASEINLVPKGKWGQQGTMVMPAAYQPDQGLAQSVFDDLDAALESCRQGRNIPQVLMNALVGKYKFQREIKHYITGLNPSPSDQPERVDHISGNAKFVPILDAKLLYREDGIWVTPKGVFDVFREYEYTYCYDDLQIFFIEGGKRANLFLSLKFRPGEDAWEASNDHLCARDLYKGTFRVAFDGVAVKSISIEYRVSGPQKNYVSKTKLELL